MSTPPDKLAAFFALLDQRSKEEEARKAQERKEANDRRLKTVRAWWLDAAG